MWTFLDCVSYDMEKFIELGKTFGLEGAELLAFVRKEEQREQKRREEEREEKRKEEEREEKRREEEREDKRRGIDGRRRERREIEDNRRGESGET